MTLDEFMKLEHLQKAMSIKAAWHVLSVTRKFEEAKGISSKTKLNEILAIDLQTMSKAHYMHLALEIYTHRLHKASFKDPRIKPLLVLLG